MAHVRQSIAQLMRKQQQTRNRGEAGQSQTLPSCLRGDHVGSGGDQMRDDGKLDSELNERLIKSIEGNTKTVIFGRLVDKN